MRHCSASSGLGKRCRDCRWLARTGISTNAAVPQKPVRKTALGASLWFAALLKGSQSAPGRWNQIRRLTEMV